MNRKVTLIGIMLSICIVSLSWAKSKDSPGTAGAPFLKIPIGPKAAAMGGAFSALADGISGSYWNPAGLVQLNRPEISTMYNSWFKGTGHGFIGLGSPITEESSLGINIVHLRINGLHGYEDAEANKIPVSTGDFSASDTAFTFSYAQLLTQSIAFGLNIKGIMQKVRDDKTVGFAVDFGQIYQLPFDGLSLAVVVQNMGPKIKFIEKEDKLPLTLRFGSAYKFPYQHLIVSCDLVKPVDNNWKLNLGLETSFKGIVALRAGFDSQVFKDLGQGLTCGLGFKVLPYQIDYAFVPYDQLSNVHRLSITFRFDVE